MSRTLLNWGIFFIVLGAIPLAVMWGVIDPGAAQGLLRLWPLILIGIGVGLLLRLTPAAPIGGVVVAATAGMLGGALLAGGFAGFGGTCAGGTADGEVTTRAGQFTGSGTSVEMELTCVALTVERGAGTAWAVEARHASGSPPQIDESASGLRLRTGQGTFVFPFGGDSRRDWRVTLPADSRLGMGLTLNASQGDVVIGGGELDSVSGTLNASDVRIDMSAAGTSAQSVNFTLNASSGAVSLPPESVSGNMTLNASSLEMCVAPEVGLRIQYNDTLSSDNFAAAGMRRNGDAWEDDAYGTAAQRIDLHVSSNVSSINISRAGGCE